MNTLTEPCHLWRACACIFVAQPHLCTLMRFALLLCWCCVDILLCCYVNVIVHLFFVWRVPASRDIWLWWYAYKKRWKAKRNKYFKSNMFVLKRIWICVHRTQCFVRDKMLFWVIVFVSRSCTCVNRISFSSVPYLFRTHTFLTGIN